MRCRCHLLSSRSPSLIIYCKVKHNLVHIRSKEGILTGFAVILLPCAGPAADSICSELSPLGGDSRSRGQNSCRPIGQNQNHLSRQVGCSARWKEETLFRFWSITWPKWTMWDHIWVIRCLLTVNSSSLSNVSIRKHNGITKKSLVNNWTNEQSTAQTVVVHWCN